MILRRGIAALGFAVTAACVSAGPKVEAPDSIEVVYVPEKMAYGISASGAAHILGAVPERDVHFPSDTEDFERIAALLEPLKAGGLACSSPSEHVRPGYIVWRQAGVEVHRVEMHTLCYAGDERPLVKNADTAWQLMQGWGRERYVAPSIPAPAGLRIEYRYWGNLRAAWRAGADGSAGRTVDGAEEDFAISSEQFSELRALFRDYESRHFECERIIADLPYGDVIWLAEDGSELQRTRFDEGCVGGDAADLFDRLHQAETLLEIWHQASADEAEPASARR
jgi:hypothetical protein